MTLLDYFRALFNRSFSGKRYIVLLTTYLDESVNSERGKSVMVVAGLMAPEEGWREFQPRWESVLRERGVPPFHATDFEYPEGPLKGWPNGKTWSEAKQDRAALSEALLDAIASVQKTIVVVGCGLVTSDFEALSDAERTSVLNLFAKRQRPGSNRRTDKRMKSDAYEFCTLTTICRTWGWLAANSAPQCRVAFIHEENPYPGGAAEGFRLMRSNAGGSSRCDTLTPAPKTAFAQLQAADLIAYEFAKEILRLLGAHDRDRRLRVCAIEEMLARTGAPGYFDAAGLRGLIERVQSPHSALEDQ